MVRSRSFGDGTSRNRRDGHAGDLFAKSGDGGGIFHCRGGSGRAGCLALWCPIEPTTMGSQVGPNGEPKWLDYRRDGYIGARRTHRRRRYNHDVRGGVFWNFPCCYWL